MLGRILKLVFCVPLLITLGSRSASGQTAVATTNYVPVVAATNYLLSPNDVVHIQVFKEPNLDTKARVANDGSIIFPLLGPVALGGKSLGQATTFLQTLLEKDYLVSPQVTLEVVEFAKRRFTILGQVQKPGPYEFPDDQPTMNVIQAISMAGGYTRIAAPTKVKVRRKQGDRILTFNVDAKAMMKGNNKPFEILRDDTVEVGESLF